jgi:hypothetical protein
MRDQHLSPLDAPSPGPFKKSGYGFLIARLSGVAWMRLWSESIGAYLCKPS